MSSFSLQDCPRGLEDQGVYGCEDIPWGMSPAIELLEPPGDVPTAFVPWQHYDIYSGAFPLDMAQG